jgi:hypothetical protein
MYVAGTTELAESALEFWARVQKDDGAWLRSLAARMAETGAVGSLLRFGRPPADYGRSVSFDFEVGTGACGGGALFVRWDAHHARFEGDIELIPTGPYACRLRLSASYEPSWPVGHDDRVTLQVMADEAGRAFLRRLAASAAWPAVPLPAESLVTSAGSARRRVLIEDEDPAWHQLMVRLCDPGEYEFASCRGPLLTEGGCPVLRGENCPKVEWADTILHSLDRRWPVNAAVLGALKRRWPDGALALIDGEPTTFCLNRRRSWPPLPPAA